MTAPAIDTPRHRRGRMSAPPVFLGPIHARILVDVPAPSTPTARQRERLERLAVLHRRRSADLYRRAAWHRHAAIWPDQVTKFAWLPTHDHMSHATALADEARGHWDHARACELVADGRLSALVIWN